MSLAPPQALNATHIVDGFDCGKGSMNEWLMRHALQAQSSASAKTYVVAQEENRRVVGYFSLTVGQIDILDAPERVRKGMGNYPIPVVILARLAVARQLHGQGLGMLQDAIRRTVAISGQAGVRALLTHPIDEDAERFYLRFGFEVSPVRQQQLLLLLKDARKLLSEY